MGPVRTLIRGPTVIDTQTPASNERAPIQRPDLLWTTSNGYAGLSSTSRLYINPNTAAPQNLALPAATSAQASSRRNPSARPPLRSTPLSHGGGGRGVRAADEVRQGGVRGDAGAAAQDPHHPLLQERQEPRERYDRPPTAVPAPFPGGWMGFISCGIGFDRADM